MVTRVFVEKRKGFDVEARHMMADLRQNLGLKAIEDLRILNRYDVSGLSGEEFEAAARTILSEPNVDNVYDENYKISSEYHVFATEFLPGQYDQRADSASQCVQLLTQGERPQVAYAKVIAVKGDLSEEEIRASLNPSLYVGRCPSQVTEFVQDVIDPIVRRHPHENISTEINL